MFRLNSLRPSRAGIFALSLFALQITGWRAEAALPPPPTDPVEQCKVILKYEGLCGNYRPNPCLNKPGIDYFHNLEQQKIWDNYFYLCVNIPGKTADRYSHECIKFLDIGGTCTSTVPELVEYQIATTARATVQTIQQTPKYEVAGTISATYCGMLSETNTTIYNYFQACGDVPASQCSNAGAPIAAFQAACGTKKPCECVKSYGCTRDYCPTTPSPATPPAPPAEPGTEGGAPGDGSAPTDGGAPPAPAPGVATNGGNSFVLGVPEGGSPEKSGGAAATGKAGGCSLANSSETMPRTFAWALMLGFLFPTLGFRGLYFFKSLSQR